MKERTIFRIIGAMLMLVLIGQASAQVPQSFNYQAVARNSLGNLLTNQTVGLKITIHQGSSTGAVVYSETQVPTTNQFGLITAAIGQGTVVSGTFANIDWSTGNYWLQVQLDPAGGTAYTDMGTDQLLSVPYAMYADGSLPEGKIGQTLMHDGTDWIANSFLSNSGTTVGIGAITLSPLTNLHVASNKRYAGLFTSDSVSYLTHVIHAEYNGAASMTDVRAVYGKSVVQDNWGVGGEFVGGFHGVNGTVLPTGSASYTGVYGFVSGGSGNNYGLYGYVNGTGTNYGAYLNSSGSATTNYGLYATASGAINNYAGYFNSGNVIINAGKVGVGTSTLLSDLDILQSGGSATNQGTGGINLRNGTYHWRIYNSNNYVRFNYSSDGGATYTPKAYVNPSDGSWNQLSDMSLKTNVEKLDDVLDKVISISIIKYNYNDNKLGSPKVIGTSANDLAKIFPEIVSTEADGGLLGVDYSKLGVIAIKAIQELNAKIVQLENRIVELESK
jgi:hypothetical protein